MIDTTSTQPQPASGSDVQQDPTATQSLLISREEILSQMIDPAMLNQLYEVRDNGQNYKQRFRKIAFPFKIIYRARIYCVILNVYNRQPEAK